MSNNPDHYCMCLRPHTDADGTKAALLNKYRWPEKATITVRFLGGDPTLQDRVKTAAQEWIAPGMAKLYLSFKPMSEKNTRYFASHFSRAKDPGLISARIADIFPSPSRRLTSDGST